MLGQTTWLRFVNGSLHLLLVWGEQSVTCNRRDRVTIDLRGIGPALHARAAARGITLAALVRSATVAVLDAEPDDTGAAIVEKSADPRLVKMTVRLSASHAARIAAHASASDVSQGAYVAALVDGTPPSPKPPDHAGAVAALIASTSALAAMSSDLNAFMRLLSRGASAEVEKYRAGVMSLSDDVRRHLLVASRLISELRPAGQASGRALSVRRHGRTPG